jgi:hypothetical protein
MTVTMTMTADLSNTSAPASEATCCSSVAWYGDVTGYFQSVLCQGDAAAGQACCDTKPAGNSNGMKCF